MLANSKNMLTNNINQHIIDTYQQTKSKKEVIYMLAEKEKKIIENFALIIPRLSESDKSYLLGLGEGMAIKIDMQKKDEEQEDTKDT